MKLNPTVLKKQALSNTLNTNIEAEYKQTSYFRYAIQKKKIACIMILQDLHDHQSIHASFSRIDKSRTLNGEFYSKPILVVFMTMQQSGR